AGLVHLAAARTEDERRTVFAAIGPVWDGNEVWLVASGGVLFFAFPRAYAAAFGGFYLPLMIVLWLLVLRGLSIEFRAQWDNPLWRAFLDASFAFSSALLAFVLGASLGNVVRGVPLDGDGAFMAPLFGPGGALDAYTALVGLFAAGALTLHGAAYLAWKCEGELHARCRRLIRRAVPTVALAFAWRATTRGRDRATFFATTTLLAALLAATATSLYPIVLRSTIDERFDVTAPAAATGHHGLAWGLIWWLPALALSVVYFAYLFRSFAGKVRASHH